MPPAQPFGLTAAIRTGSAWPASGSGSDRRTMTPVTKVST